MVIRVTTDQGDELVRSGFTCSPSRFTREGVQTVTISYGSQSCTLELTVAPGEAKPEPTKSPDQKGEEETDPSAEDPDSRDETRREDSRSRRATSTMLMVIIFTALVALVALLAYLYVTKKDELIALWQQLLSRFGKGGRQ